MKTFKSRFIQEADEAGKASPTQPVSNFINQSIAPPRPESPETKTIVKSVVAPQQSIIKATEATDDMNIAAKGNPTPNDADKMNRTLQNQDRSDAKWSSNTPFNSNLQEAEVAGIDLDARIPGKYDNQLSKRLKEIGINTGFDKKALTQTPDTKEKKGNAKVTTGTKASFGLGRSDAKRQARDGLKTGTKEIDKATLLTASAYLKIGELVEEYTSIDAQRAGKTPGSAPKIRQEGFGVKVANKTQQTQEMVRNMNAVIDDKMKRRMALTKQTMPKDDPAMTKTGGIHLQQSNIVKSWKDREAAVKEAREQRIAQQQEAQGGQ
jgi:hypothetical protein